MEDSHLKDEMIENNYINKWELLIIFVNKFYFTNILFNKFYLK